MINEKRTFRYKRRQLFKKLSVKIDSYSVFLAVADCCIFIISFYYLSHVRSFDISFPMKVTISALVVSAFNLLITLLNII